MKRKFLYFIIAYVFAIVTTSSATQNTSLPVFREVTTNRIFEDIQKNNEKNYPIFTIKKIDMEKGITHKDEIVYLENMLKIEVCSFPGMKTELIEKVIRLSPSYTILSRYKSRVLRN